jgi:RecA/RadA recombinase
MKPPAWRERLVADLRERLHQIETSRRPAVLHPVSTGCTALDGLLPERGLTRGTLVEWLGQDEASGAGMLALTAAWQACREEGPGH